MSKTIGFYGGKFYPLHSGHVYAMTVASTIVDELYVIVSHDDEYERNELLKDSKIPHIDYKLRVRWWKEITKDMPHVHVKEVSETNNGLFESWKIGADRIIEAIGSPITHVFSSESAYEEFFTKLYPDAEHVVIDEKRVRYDISATKLRNEGVYKNWSMIPEVVRRHFVKKVVVVGTESCGKSQLIMNLARLYDTNYVEEHGRTFYEELGSYETFEEDYEEIAYRHKHYEREGLKSANKLLFIDTEAIVTQRFLKQYHNTFSNVLKEIANRQKYDLWLFLEPDVKWVDDSTRNLGEQEIRERGHRLLQLLLEMHNVDYMVINGNYENRLRESMKQIDKLLI